MGDRDAEIVGDGLPDIGKCGAHAEIARQRRPGAP